MASNDELENRLDSSLYGTPQLKPDEQRHYLGTFRERVALTLDFKEVKNSDYLEILKKELESHPEYHLLINGNVPSGSFSALIKISRQTNTNFETVANNTTNSESELAAVVASKDTALNLSNVDVAHKN
ncbi:YueI family protein [Liquorilactobacillus oeni]|nr:YueI family protein [Liquorilactobacillus oeni]